MRKEERRKSVGAKGPEREMEEIRNRKIVKKRK